MESIMLAIKFLLFYGLEVIVLTVIGAVLIAGLYQFVRRQIRIIQKGPYPPHALLDDEKIVVWVDGQRIELNTEAWLRGH